MRVGGGGGRGEARGARNRSSRSGRMSLGEQAAKAVVAGAALIADAAELEIANGARTVVDGSGNVPVGFAAADADDHWRYSLALETQSQQNNDPMPARIRQEWNPDCNDSGV